MKFEWKPLWKAGVVVFAFCLLWKYMGAVHTFITTVIGAIAPLFIGGIIAFFINILMSFYENKLFGNAKRRWILKSRRGISIILAIITLCAIVSAVLAFVLPQFISCVKLIIQLFPKAIKSVANWLDNYDVVPNSIVNFLSTTDWASKTDQIVNLLSSGIGNTVQMVFSTVTSIFSGFVTAFLSIFFAIYLLIYKDSLIRQMKRISRVYLPEKITKKIFYVGHVFNTTFRKYVIGQCTEALILGVLCIIGMLILRIPYAAMIGTLIALTALIPIAGAYIGAIVGALMIITVSPIKALIFLIFIVILQQIEGNLIYPKVVGTSIGLPGIWVLAAVTVGGSVMGIVGMLLGVPLTACIYRIIRHDLNKRDPQEPPKEPSDTPAHKEKEEVPK